MKNIIKFSIFWLLASTVCVQGQEVYKDSVTEANHRYNINSQVTHFYDFSKSYPTYDNVGKTYITQGTGYVYQQDETHPDRFRSGYVMERNKDIAISQAYLDITRVVSNNILRSTNGFSISFWFDPTGISNFMDKTIDLMSIYQTSTTPSAATQAISMKMEKGVINIYEKTKLQTDLSLSSDMIKRMVARYPVSRDDGTFNQTAVDIHAGYIFVCITSDQYSTRIYFTRPNGELYATYFWLGFQEVLDVSKDNIIGFGCDVKNPGDDVPYAFDDIMLYNTSLSIEEAENNYLMQCTLLPDRSIQLENAKETVYPYLVNAVIKEDSGGEEIVTNADKNFNYNNYFTATSMLYDEAYKNQPTHPLKWYIDGLLPTTSLHGFLVDLKNTSSGGSFYSAQDATLASYGYPYQYYSYNYPGYTGFIINYDYYLKDDAFTYLLQPNVHSINLAHPASFQSPGLGDWLGYSSNSLEGKKEGQETTYAGKNFDYVYYRHTYLDYCYWNITGSFKQIRDERIPASNHNIRLKNVYTNKYLQFYKGYYGDYFIFTDDVSKAAEFNLVEVPDESGEYTMVYHDPTTNTNVNVGPSSNAYITDDYFVPFSKTKGKVRMIYVKKNLNEQFIYRIADRTYKENGYSRYLTVGNQNHIDTYLRVEPFENGRPSGGENEPWDLWLIEALN